MEKLKLKYAKELAKFAEQKKNIRRLWNVDETTAGALYLLTVIHKASYIVEVGTSNGYSTFWLSVAAEKNSGIVHSFEVDENRYKMAVENLASRKNIILHQGLAEENLPLLNDGIDLVFIDAGKPAYLKYLMILKPKLRPNALILADNVTSHPDTTAHYIEYMKNSNEFTELILPMEAGLSVAVYNEKVR